MYLTFFTQGKEKQVDFDWILQNIFATNFNFNEEAKKVTIEIDEEYGEKLYNKRNRTLPPTPPLIPYEDINNSYRHCQIPKKSNPKKKRQLDIPNDSLKLIQSFYKVFIEDYLQVQPHTAAYAYVKQRGIVQANELHQKNESKWFLQIDLKDFFPSINEEFLRRMLLEVYPFKFIPEEHFENIINYALYNDAIPQGSPLSPTLTNILMVPIDHAIRERLHNHNKKHYVYTRYADDIKISCKYDFDPKEIVQIILDIFKLFNAPLKINHEKTRYGNIAGKNFYLGVILNKDNKISPGWRKNKSFRAMLHNFILNGESWETNRIQKMVGIISYYKAIEPDFVENTIRKYNEKFGIDIMLKAKSLLR